MHERAELACLFLALFPALLSGAEPVSIRVDAAKTSGRSKPIFTYFGYDEPNYTYANNGRKLLGELAALSRVPVYVRTHFLLASGDGTPALKWGSTNAYTEDASGRPVYNWAIVDRIFDTYVHTGLKPFVEIGFMPEALSTHPEPYHPDWAPGSSFKNYYTGWSWPPTDYAKWSDLVSHLVRHAVERYGRAEVETWLWEVWNEPDIAYWHGSPEDYDKLYDYSAAAVKSVLPGARVGGPASTGPSNAKAAGFLRQFLEHCAGGKNFSTGAAGAPLDFISYHAKGSPSVVDGQVRMGIAHQVRNVEDGVQIVSAFPKFRKLPIILSESDPEGCAACSARVYPPNAYRNGPLYAAYTAVVWNSIFDIAERSGAAIEGMLTWAFEFEDQPWFDGLRTLATNGVDKPVLNFFRMAGLMRGDRVRVESSGTVDLKTILSEGVRGAPDVSAVATRAERELSVLAWNYHDVDGPADSAEVRLAIRGIPAGVGRVLVRHYRVDQDHSNAYALWKQLGSPQKPSPEQYAALEAAGQLAQLASPAWLNVKSGVAELTFSLPREALSLVQVSW